MRTGYMSKLGPVVMVSCALSIACALLSGCAKETTVAGQQGEEDELLFPKDKPGGEEPSQDDPPAEPRGRADDPGTSPAGDPGCVDYDQDLHGEGCQAGADCDDENPNFFSSCPDCMTQVLSGCPCHAPGKLMQCYEGPLGTSGVGVCIAGSRECLQNGFWGDCVGQVVPKDEVCDGLDDDCDGNVDEGVLSPCGNCDPQCDGVQAGPGTPLPFAPDGENSEGVGLTPEGFLTLDAEEIDLSLIWIANSGEGTVSKLDTKTGKELGRYYTCADPSRTAVDLLGDVWVACRADGGVAKIRRHELACQDKNGNGFIDTSRDLDGNGKISPGEMVPPGQDECVKFVVYPGGGCQRAAGVDSENYAWIGEWNQPTLRRLHPEDGSVVQTIAIPNNPYGLVVDSKNIIWVAGRGGSRLVRVDPATGTVNSYQSPVSPTDPYGINIDSKGRVWFANCCGSHVAVRFDPVTGQWAQAQTQGRPRGIAASLNGRVYVANDESNSVAVIDADTMQNLGQISLGGGRFPVGMAVDFDGFVWAVNQGTSSATKIDATTGTIVGEYPVGSAPYTYSDMTGYTLHNFTAPQGYYQETFGLVGPLPGSVSADPNKIQWTSVSVDAEVPQGSHLEVEARVGNTKEALAIAAWQGPAGPFPDQTFPFDTTSWNLIGQFLELRVWLVSDTQQTAPVVKKLSATFKVNP